MSSLRSLQKMIKENEGFLEKWQRDAEANPDDFGAKLMVGNIRRHLDDLRRQEQALLSGNNSSSPAPAPAKIAVKGR